MEITDEIRRDAERVLALLPSARQWLKGEYQNTTRGRRCLWQAACDINEGEQQIKLGGRNRNAPDDLVEALTEVIREQYAERMYYPFGESTSVEQDDELVPGQVITWFNDNRKTRYADVRKVLEKVIAG